MYTNSIKQNECIHYYVLRVIRLSFSMVIDFYCTQPPHTEMTKLLCPHHEGAGSPHPIRVGGPDLWYQMALVDTTVHYM
jgi:hypothetical protein